MLTKKHLLIDAQVSWLHYLITNLVLVHILVIITGLVIGAQCICFQNILPVLQKLRTLYTTLKRHWHDFLIELSSRKSKQNQLCGHLLSCRILVFCVMCEKTVFLNFTETEGMLGIRKNCREGWSRISGQSTGITFIPKDVRSSHLQFSRYKTTS